MSQNTNYIYAVNKTGAKIIKGHITHATQDYGIQSIQLEGLENGAKTENVKMYTGPSSRDYWYIAWTTDDNGENWTAWSGRNAISGHESDGAPGSITLSGQLKKGGLQVTFVTDGDTTDNEPIKNPWG